MKQSVEIRGGGTIFFSFPSTNKICHFRFLINSWQQSVQNIHWPNVWRKFVQIGCRNVKSHYAHSILCYPILTMNLQPLWWGKFNHYSIYKFSVKVEWTFFCNNNVIRSQPIPRSENAPDIDSARRFIPTTSDRFSFFMYSSTHGCYNVLLLNIFSSYGAILKWTIS